MDKPVLDLTTPEDKLQSTVEQLGLLKEVTRMYGIIQEAQVFQLKFWPYVVFPTIVSHTIEIPLDEEGVIASPEITYLLKIKGPVPKDFKERADKLSQSIKWLLGPDWTIKIKAKNKVVYRGT